MAFQDQLMVRYMERCGRWPPPKGLLDRVMHQVKEVEELLKHEFSQIEREYFLHANLDDAAFRYLVDITIPTWRLDPSLEISKLVIDYIYDVHDTPNTVPHTKTFRGQDDVLIDIQSMKAVRGQDHIASRTLYKGNDVIDEAEPVIDEAEGAIQTENMAYKDGTQYYRTEYQYGGVTLITLHNNPRKDNT